MAARSLDWSAMRFLRWAKVQPSRREVWIRPKSGLNLISVSKALLT